MLFVPQTNSICLLVLTLLRGAEGPLVDFLAAGSSPSSKLSASVKRKRASVNLLGPAQNCKISGTSVYLYCNRRMSLVLLMVNFYFLNSHEFTEIEKLYLWLRFKTNMVPLQATTWYCLFLKLSNKYNFFVSGNSCKFLK